MARESIIWGVLVVGCAVQVLSVTTEDSPPEYMSREERESLKEEARDMFYHAYNAYMDNAYPADELMPLSCKGRYRGSEPDRGNIDSTLGNFSLTLVDTLDTLVVLGDLEEFENAVRLVVEDVKFDTDVIVSLFETNIRILGGLLSGHILAEYLQLRADIMSWYRGELLDLAKDLGYRFLPAFNTTTGIPFGRINLRHGMKGVPAEMCRETCTACAGSMILEMAALSRLTGESIFEEKAQKAMDALWKMRHRGTDLMGSVLNVHSGDWVRRDSGVGAGIDSYYEYCLKAYILLGDEKYLGRFNKHYQAVMKYVSQGPMLLDVHMHRPNTNSKNFMDALLAFWPGLQVLKGDIKPAVETHEMLYQVMQRHNFIPEAFTTDFQVHWGHHPLRPEFLESTYFLYRATGDHYYLGVGRKVLKSLQTYARVTCGYAAVSDVRTNKHDDTMDSFVLSETFKYLFLLFAEPNDLVLDLDEFIFTTEGHLLPLTLAAVRTNVTADLDRDIVQVDELDRTCPNSLHLFPATVRQPLRNMVEDVCPRRSMKRRLNASQFQANNLEHLKILGNMGITILTLADGRVQLLHTFSNARTAQDAEEGLLFMQEMVELSKKQSQESETRPQFVAYVRNDVTPPQEVTLLAGPAHFGPGFRDGKRVTGMVEFASPSEACSDLVEPNKLIGKVVMVARGNCMFIEKARRIQKAGAIAGIVLDTVGSSSASVSPMFAMSGDGKEPDDVTIPVVFLFNKEATELVGSHIANDRQLTVTLGDFPRNEVQLKAPGDLSVFEQLKGSLKDFLSRQVTSQNLEITSRPVAASTSAKVEDDTEDAVSVEYAQFKALIYNDKDIVKIQNTGSVPASTRTSSSSSSSQSLNTIEKMWHAAKERYVNLIYLRQTSGFHSGLPTFIEFSIPKVQFEYTTIRKVRLLDTVLPVDKTSRNRVLIKWLLKELSEVQPALTLIDAVAKIKFTNAAIKEDGANDERKFESKNELVQRFEATNRKMLILIDAQTKRSNADSMRPDIEALGLELKEEILSSLAGESNEVTKEPSAQSLRSNFLDFKSSLVTDNEKAAEAHGKVVRTVDKEQNTVLSYAHLKATIYEDKNIVKFGKTDVIPSATIPPPRFDDSNINSDRAWYEVKRHHLNLMYSLPEPSMEISAEMLGLYYMVRMQRDPNYRSSAGAFQDRVAWYLKELSQVQPNLKVIQVYVYLRLRQEFQTSLDIESMRKRLEEDIAALKINFPNLEKNSSSEDIVPEIWKWELGDRGIQSYSKSNVTVSKAVRTTDHNNTVLSYAHLKAIIFQDKRIVKFSKTDVIPTATIPPDSLDKSSPISEQNWYNQRQNLLSFMYSDPNHSISITAEDVRLQYSTMHMLYDFNYQPATESLEHMVEWFLIELSTVQPDPKLLEIFVLRNVIKRFVPPFDLRLIRERFDRDIAALDIRIPNFDRRLNNESILTKIEKAAASRSSEQPGESENTRNAKDKDKNDVEKEL